MSAAADNASWCAALCRAHGLVTHTDSRRWWSPTRTPTFYPDAITLDPATTAQEVLQGIDSGAGASVKDSFGVLDLTGAGFRVLFDASWIHLDPEVRPASGAEVQLEEVQAPDGLQRWLDVWGEEGRAVFLPSILQDPDVRLIRLGAGAGTAGVAVFSRSAAGVGVSNVVSVGSASVWPLVPAAAAMVFPGLELFGYEVCGDLEDAVAAGFSPIGSLRIWGSVGEHA